MIRCLVVTCCLSWSHHGSSAPGTRHHSHHWHPLKWCFYNRFDPGWTCFDLKEASTVLFLRKDHFVISSLEFWPVGYSGCVKTVKIAFARTVCVFTCRKRVLRRWHGKNNALLTSFTCLYLPLPSALSPDLSPGKLSSNWLDSVL